VVKKSAAILGFFRAMVLRLRWRKARATSLRMTRFFAIKEVELKADC